MANIYLSKLDDFAENLKKSFNKGKSKENLEYQRAASKLYYIRRKNRANWENWNEQQRKEALRLQKDAINYMHSLPSKRANKSQIKEAVEKMFEGTKVKSVNTMNMDGKKKRRGAVVGKTAKTKKAIVALTEESKDIEIFEGL